MSQTANRIVKNTGFLYVRMGITMFISLWSTRLVLNALGVSDFGIFGIVGGAIAMLGFLNASMSNATQRFMSYSQGKNDPEEQKTVFNCSLLIHIIISIVVIILLEIAAYPLFNGVLSIPPDRMNAAQQVYQFMILSTALTIVSVPYDAAITAHENMGYYAIIGVIESIFKLSIAFYVVKTLNDKLIVYGLLMAALTAIMLIIKMSYCRLKYEECIIDKKYFYKRDITKEIVHFAGWSFARNVGTVVGNNGGEVVLNHYFGPSVNAAGGVGAQLRGQMMAFSNGLLKALNPVIVKKEGGGERESMLKFSITGAKMSYLLFAVLALPFIIEAPYILKLWLKNVPEWAVCFSRLQMLTGLGEQITITMGTALAATGYIKNYNIFSGIAHFLPLLLYVILFSMGAPPYLLYLTCLINFVFIDRGFLLIQCKNHCGLDIKAFLIEVVVPIVTISALTSVMGIVITNYINPSIERCALVFIIVNGLFLTLSYRYLFDQEEKNVIKFIIHKVSLSKIKI